MKAKYALCHWCASMVSSAQNIDHNYSLGWDGCDLCGCRVGVNIVELTGDEAAFIYQTPVGCFRP
jgi:transcription elongation factor Elf1